MQIYVPTFGQGIEDRDSVRGNNLGQQHQAHLAILNSPALGFGPGFRENSHSFAKKCFCFWLNFARLGLQSLQPVAMKTSWYMRSGRDFLGVPHAAGMP